MDHASGQLVPTDERSQFDRAQAAGLRAAVSSRKNAVTHGLTARVLLPEILGPDVFARHRESFCAEWAPRTPTELHLVEELARHAAALERATPMEESTLRMAAQNLVTIIDPDAGTDSMLAAACGSDTVDRLTRYRRAHEKGFDAALSRLRELRERAVTTSGSAPCAVGPLRFEEPICQRYLRQRHETGKAPCSSCQSAKGKWLPKRDVWQCRGCRRQSTSRSGSVMERSSVALNIWFMAIAAILQDRQITTAALCEMTAIRRHKTVRGMADRIREALRSPDSERLLAGLDLAILNQLAQTRC